MDGETALFGDTSLALSNAQVAQATRTYRDRNIKKPSCTAPGSKGGSPTQITAPSRSSHNLHTDPPSCRSTKERPSSSPSPFFLHFYASSFAVDIHTLTMSYHFFRPAIFTGQKSKVWSQSCTRVILLVSCLRAQCHLFFVQGICSLSSEAPWRSVSDVALGQQSPSILRCRPFLACGSNSVHSDVRFLSSLDVGSSQHSTQLSWLPSSTRTDASHGACRLFIQNSPGFVWRGGVLCILLEGRTAPEKNAVMIRNGSLCRVLDSVLRSLLNGRV